MTLSGIKIATLATGLLDESAFADWSFTRWGMTPQQVVHASKGRAALFDGSLSGGTTGWPEGAKGTP
jgi:hypothetical protein